MERHVSRHMHGCPLKKGIRYLRREGKAFLPCLPGPLPDKRTQLKLLQSHRRIAVASKLIVNITNIIIVNIMNVSYDTNRRSSTASNYWSIRIASISIIHSERYTFCLIFILFTSTWFITNLQNPWHASKVSSSFVYLYFYDKTSIILTHFKHNTISLGIIKL